MKKVIIVGGGLSGLHCGLLLLRKGFDVTILEQHSTVGGLAAGFKRKGYYFDSGMARFASDSLTGYFEEAGIRERVQFHKHSASIRIGNKTYETRTVEDFINACVDYFPDESGILLRLYKEKIKEPAAFMIIQNEIGPMSYKGAKLFGKMLNVMGKTLFSGHAGGMGALMKSDQAGLKDLLNEYFGESSPSAKYIYEITANMFNKGGSTSLMTFIGSICSNMELNRYPHNGFLNLCNTYAEEISKGGGHIKTGAKVTRICCQNSSATDVEYRYKGQIVTETCDRIVYAADIKKLYSELLGPESSDPSVVSALSAQETTAPIPILYMGVKIDREILRERFKNAQELIYYPDLTGEFSEKDYFMHSPMILHCSCLDSPEHAPQGCSNIQVYLASPPDGWMDNWGLNDGKKSEEYEKIKGLVTEQTLQNIRNILPELNDRSLIEVCELGTPYTFERFTGNSNGAHCAFTWDRACNKVNPRMGTYQSRHEKIRNLFIAGHWTGYLGGATNALGSARNVAKIID